jgi:hypothetical protein
VVRLSYSAHISARRCTSLGRLGPLRLTFSFLTYHSGVEGALAKEREARGAAKEGESGTSLIFSCSREAISQHRRRGASSADLDQASLRVVPTRLTRAVLAPASSTSSPRSGL